MCNPWGKDNNMKKQNINNKVTEKEQPANKDFTLHVMPSQISDEDIQALFGGLLKIVQKKYELDTRAEIINLNLTHDKLIKALNEKQAECNRLKNEIIYLKAKMKN